MGSTASVWMESVETPVRPMLRQDTLADVCVIGAGISGLTTAYLLACEGKATVILDDGPVAGGETSGTTAHLVNALDDRYFALERLPGPQGPRLAAASHTTAVDRIEALIA